MFHKQNFEIRFFVSKSENDGSFPEYGDVIMIVKSPYQSSMLWTFCYSLDPESLVNYRVSQISDNFINPEEDSIVAMASKFFSSSSLVEINRENFSLYTLLSMQQSYQSSKNSLSFHNKILNNIVLQLDSPITSDAYSSCKITSTLDDINHTITYEKESEADQKTKEDELCEFHNSNEDNRNTGLLYMSNQMELDLTYEHETEPKNISQLRSYLFSV